MILYVLPREDVEYGYDFTTHVYFGRTLHRCPLPDTPIKLCNILESIVYRCKLFKVVVFINVYDN